VDVFEFKDIREWTDDGQTALCPSCGVDSVIGDASGFPITVEFLTAMEAHWFGLPDRPESGAAQDGPRD
jgi:hypothetical protein